MDQGKEFNEVLAVIPQALHPIATDIVKQLKSLDEMETSLHQAIAIQGTVEVFENGKQRMLRTSPATKTWLDLLKQRMALYDRLTKLVPKSARGEAEPEERDELAEFIDARDDE